MLRIGTKADLGGSDEEGVDLTVSAAVGVGLAALFDRIGREAEAAPGGGDAVITRERHRRALETSEAALVRAQAALADEPYAELAAEDVRLAFRALGAITGRVDVEEVLDRLFATFCIGK